MKAAMGVTNSVSRAFMADLCLKLGEKAASGEKVPQWIGITNPVARRRCRAPRRRLHLEVPVANTQPVHAGTTERPGPHSHR
jgi:hypothetical protein